MDTLRYLDSFLSVLHHGSLSAAARACKISQPAISQQMSALEAFYDAPLLQRSTTGVTPTRAGSIVAQHAQRLVDEHRQMQAAIMSLSTSAKGQLRISMSQFMGDSAVGEKIQALRATYPDLSVVLKVEDHLVDVVRDGYDLALRAGELGETDGIVRKIARMDTMLVATPDYLNRVGRPSDHLGLKQLSNIQYAEYRANGFVSLKRNAAEIEAEIVTGMIVDTPQHLVNALMNGYGFARVPALLANPLIKKGQIENVLPEYTVGPKNIYLIYPHRHALNHGMRLVIGAIYDGLAQFEGVRLLSHADLQLAA